MSTSDREFQKELKRMRKEIDAVQAAIAKESWTLEEVSAKLGGWQTQKQKKQAETPPGKKRKGKQKGPAARKEVPEKHPQAVRTSNSSNVVEPVNNVIIEHDRHGLMFVHVEDNELAVPLQNMQRIRQLLLALGGKVSRINMPTEGVIPFKSKTELIEAIEELSGQRISVNNLLNLVQKLRALFVKARISPKLIETGGGGYRLRLYIEGRIFENVS